MLRDLENPGTVRIIILLVAVVAAALVVVGTSPAIVHSDLQTGVQSFLH